MRISARELNEEIFWLRNSSEVQRKVNYVQRIVSLLEAIHVMPNSDPVRIDEKPLI